MSAMSFLLFSLFCVALSCGLRVMFAMRARPAMAADDCAGAAPAAKKGTLGEYDKSWTEAVAFHATVQFTDAADADTARTSAVLCYTEIIGGVARTATWPEDRAHTTSIPNKNQIKFAFTPVSPKALDERHHVLGTGKGTIILTQRATKYTVSGTLDPLKHGRGLTTTSGGTLWPPTPPAASAIPSSTPPPSTSTPVSWSVDTPITISFTYASTTQAANFATALLVYVDDNLFDVGYWPMTLATTVNATSGKVSLVFRPYSVPQPFGTGKGTIIVTQATSAGLVDNILTFADGSHVIKLKGPI
jgi:hypothetical protein